MQAKIKRMLCASLAGLAALTAARAESDTVYTVGNYPVDAQAKNAVAAKDKALGDGQEAAFRSLLKRLVPVTSYDRLKRLEVLRSSDFFEGVSVRSERNSRTRYIASLDFSFRADSVRAVLRQQGIPFVEEQAREIIIVPVVRDAQGAVDNGAAARGWRDTWTSLDLEHTLTPIGLKSLKPNTGADTLTSLLEGDGDAVQALAAEYGQPHVVVAVAEPDAATKRLHVTFVGVDAVGPINLKRSYRVFDGDTAYTMELAAVVGQGILEGRWKAQMSGGTAGLGAEFALQAQYGSFSEWREMRERLLKLPGVNDLRIGAESAQGANLTLRYPGSADEFSRALFSQGLILSSRAGAWVLRSSY